MSRALRQNLIPAIAVMLVGAVTSSASGHELSAGVGTQSIFQFHPDHIRLDLNLGYSAEVGFESLFRIDTSGDGKISREEEQAFLEQKPAELTPDIHLVVNGRRVELVLQEVSAEGMIGEVSPVAFDTWYVFRAQLPPELPDGGWWVHYQDGTYLQETSTQVLWIPWLEHGEDISYATFFPPAEGWVDDGAHSRVYHREMITFFDNRSRPNMRPGQTEVPTVEELAALVATGGPGAPAPVSPPPEELAVTYREGTDERKAPEGEGEELGRLTSWLRDARTGGVPFWQLVAGLVMAVVYGAGHALGPGHGKSMVAAYLAGTRGRVRDAVGLGVIVTFAHTFSVFLLGLLLVWLVNRATDAAAEATYKNWLITSFSMLSGVALVLLGLTLVRSRWKQRKNPGHHDHGWLGHSHPQLGGHHHHHHHHDHAHAHAHDHDHGAGDGAHSHSHDHGHDHKTDHSHDHGHDHGHDHSHDHGHDHSNHGHDHEHGDDHPHHGHDHDHEHGNSPAHSHDHGHVHHHADTHEPDRPPATDPSPGTSWRELLALGLSGGIVPCPAGLTIVLIAARWQALSEALILLIFFSLGLGAVLVAIGVVIALGKDFAFRQAGMSPATSRAFVGWLGVGSAVLITMIGGYFVWDSWAQGSREIGQMMIAAGEWLNGR